MANGKRTAFIRFLLRLSGWVLDETQSEQEKVVSCKDSVLKRTCPITNDSLKRNLEVSDDNEDVVREEIRKAASKL